MIDFRCPYQVALPEAATLGAHEHSFSDHGERWNVFCFAKEEDAKKFMDKFGGEKFDPAKRGRGRNGAEEVSSGRSEMSDLTCSVYSRLKSASF